MSQNAENNEPKKLRMVGWYDPRQLAQTGVEVAISTIFGRHSDQRLVEAMASGGKKSRTITTTRVTTPTMVRTL